MKDSTNRRVILSTPMLLEEGEFAMREISLGQARAWVQENAPTNFCGHETVKVVGVEPAAGRGSCEGFDEALCLKPAGRLEFGKEYTVQEILDIGVTPLLISKVG
ncbi:hypothetical protein [Thioalkalivibrio sp. ALE19]|uniref:hypothetical protein n=1 Tax=Thioalkalivibrio sp. ALE19 TaxID=1266909 RepID=UPI00048BB29F|nr:hypothetical protein [Thioalkalivibrio sp. ALE19]